MHYCKPEVHILLSSGCPLTKNWSAKYGQILPVQLQMTQLSTSLWIPEFSLGKKK